MEKWVNEIVDLEFPEHKRVLEEKINEASVSSNGYVDYYRALVYSIAVNTLNRMPRNIYQALKEKYGDREPVILDDDADPLVDLLIEQLLTYVDVKRSGVKGKVEIKFKQGNWYKIQVIVDIPRKIVHDEYVKFFENHVCGNEMEWRHYREEEGVVHDHELFLTKKELRRYRRIC
jgi:hypothetical protein